MNPNGPAYLPLVGLVFFLQKASGNTKGEFAHTLTILIRPLIILSTLKSETTQAVKGEAQVHGMALVTVADLRGLEQAAVMGDWAHSWRPHLASNLLSTWHFPPFY